MQLLILAASCLAGGRLLLFPPPRSARSGSPHDVSMLAFLMTFGLVMLAVTAAVLPPAKTHPAVVPVEQRIGVWELQIGCLESLLVSGILILAMEVPRFLLDRSESPRPEPETAENSEPCPAPPPEPIDAPEVTRVVPHQPIHEPVNPLLEIWTGTKVGLAAIVPALLVGAVVQLVMIREDMHPYLETLRQRESLGTLLWVAIAACIFAPLKEELMFRVVLQGRLVDRFGVWGVLATALLFASVHRIPDAFMLIPLAMFLGFLYERRRTFLSVFAAHAAFNGANVLMALAIT